MKDLPIRALIKLPERARPGEIIEVKTMVSHPMETGYRTGTDGRLVARDILRVLVCTYDGAEVFRAELFPAIAANPYITFDLRATRSGEISFRWTDERGRSLTRSVQLEVA